MSERERWIIYPLLMLALGAAVRDKLMQRVDSKEIRCESLQIIDQQDPDVTLAELSFKRAIDNDPTQLSDRVGALILKDSDGNVVCDIATDVLVGRLVARQMLVVDPQLRPLVIAATEPQPTLSLRGADPAVSYRGVIYLNNQPLQPRPQPVAPRAPAVVVPSAEAAAMPVSPPAALPQPPARLRAPAKSRAPARPPPTFQPSPLPPDCRMPAGFAVPQGRELPRNLVNLCRVVSGNLV